MAKLDLNKPIRVIGTQGSKDIRSVVGVDLVAGTVELSSPRSGHTYHANIETGKGVGSCSTYENYTRTRSVFRSASNEGHDDDTYGCCTRGTLEGIVRTFANAEGYYPLFVEQVYQDDLLVDLIVHKNPNFKPA
jgi:hypothetical protein